MSEQKRTNVHVAGSGRISGGIYDTVTVAGSGRIEGDVDANLIKTAGSCRIDGDVKTKELKTAGSCRVSGDVRAERMRTVGSCIVEGDVYADEINVAGTQVVECSVKAKGITSAGLLKVTNDVEAEKFLSRGGFEIGGLLSAEEIKIELGGGKVTEIGGTRIEVRRRGRAFWGWRREPRVHLYLERGRGSEGLLESIFEELGQIGEEVERAVSESLGHTFGWSRGSGYLEAETIEGDEIFLENTKARAVRGKKIQIGEGCEIESVEYSESLEIAPGAQVKEQKRV
ncbi:MAG: polymer-forming cytoskeletal protein [Candidatus Bipolaricaulota bacterium]|nr:polymer-forming cytoskeletal protein [Candidatus Bipolaricaulota bacterium]MDW8141451.1 polymer-forming cytoskeletal protein [Candidatus Bipolaricaulota bacterium]